MSGSHGHTFVVLSSFHFAASDGATKAVGESAACADGTVFFNQTLCDAAGNWWVYFFQSFIKKNPSHVLLCFPFKTNWWQCLNGYIFLYIFVL